MSRVFDDFDGYAANYRDIHNENIKISGADSAYFAELKVRYVKKSEAGNAPRILDFGCGDGASAAYFRKHIGNCSYCGIDISSKSIEEAERKKIPGCHFKTFDGTKIPYDNETFDILFIACVFHHINADFHSRALEEILRVLKKNGRIYFFEHNPYNPVTRKIVKDCPFDKDAVLLPPPYAKKIFANSGFRNIDINFIIFFPRHKFFNRLLHLENSLTWIPLGGQYYIRAIK
jgi:ubiquinone/menaquinone biosynthesis C-methylase UbiE